MRAAQVQRLLADSDNVTLARLTRLQLIGILFGLAVLAFVFTRMGGTSETDALALPSLEEATGDEFDGFDDFGTDEELELAELASDADDALFDVEDGPVAARVDPLTGRPDDGELVDSGLLEAGLSTDPEGPVAFIDDAEGDSEEPPLPTFEQPAPGPEAAPETVTTTAEGADVSAARAALSEWLATKDVSGARIGFAFPDGSRALLTAGTEEDGTELDPDGEFLATSITKTMTASIVFNLVSEGVLSLDDPAPELGAVPEFGHSGAFTVRQLLQHTSGLASYQSSPEWSQDRELDPLTALQLAGDIDLVSTPGAGRGYSNSGYLYLGVLSEQFTGTPFHELIENRVTGPLGLDSTRIDSARRPGWVGYSAGGLISSVPDLLTWGSALYRDGSVLEPAQLDAMLDVDNEHSTGLGANVICPCGLRDGSLWYTSIGHDGGSVTLQYSPADDMITSAKFTESFWTNDLSQRDVHGLLRELRSILVEG